MEHFDSFHFSGMQRHVREQIAKFDTVIEYAREHGKSIDGTVEEAICEMNVSPTSELIDAENDFKERFDIDDYDEVSKSAIILIGINNYVRWMVLYDFASWCGGLQSWRLEEAAVYALCGGSPWKVKELKRKVERRRGEARERKCKNERKNREPLPSTSELFPPRTSYDDMVGQFGAWLTKDGAKFASVAVYAVSAVWGLIELFFWVKDNFQENVLGGVVSIIGACFIVIIGSCAIALFGGIVFCVVWLFGRVVCYNKWTLLATTILPLLLWYLYKNYGTLIFG